jgi:hypothetical protein
LRDEATERIFREVRWARGEAGAVRSLATWVDANEKIALYDAPSEVRSLGFRRPSRD